MSGLAALTRGTQWWKRTDTYSISRLERVPLRFQQKIELCFIQDGFH